MDHLGGAPTVGAAAFAVQLAIARELLESGVGIILEGPFFADQAELVEVTARGGGCTTAPTTRPRWAVPCCV